MFGIEKLINIASVNAARACLAAIVAATASLRDRSRLDMNGGESRVVAVAVPLVGSICHCHVVLHRLCHANHRPGHGLVGGALLLNESRIGLFRWRGQARGERGGLGPATLPS